MQYSIAFVFDERKATQAACYLLSLNNGRMNYMKLIKLLYLSDRKYILDFSNSITTDCYVSMDNGPVTSNIYDLIKEGKKDTGSYWSSRIHTDDYDVCMIKHEPDYGYLSPMEMEIIGSIDEQFKNYKEWDVVNYCHNNLREWQNPAGSMIRISIEDIIRAEKSGEKAEENIEETALAADIQKGNYRLMREIENGNFSR